MVRGQGHKSMKLVRFLNHRSVNILARASIKSSKCKDWLWLFSLHIQLRYHFWLKIPSWPWPRNGDSFESFEICNLVQLDIRFEKIITNYALKSVKDGTWWHQQWPHKYYDLKVSLLYSFINEISTFFQIIKKTLEISSHLVYNCSR